jgi:hypothetical protein
MHLPLCSEAKNANVCIQRECDMSRLSKLAIVQTAKRIALSVLALADGPAPVMIPIPVRVKSETQLTRRIR